MLLVVNMGMFISSLKHLPLLRWLKWVVRSKKILKNNPTARIGYSAIITPDCTLGYQNNLLPYSKMVGSSIGDYSYIGVGTQVQYADIGSFCSIGDSVRIGLGIHPTHLESTHPAFYSKQGNWDIKPIVEEEIIEYKKVSIGDDVWIGTGAMILDGVNVGSHSVIAAGAVVTKDVPEYAIMGGVPAKIIKYRRRHES